MREQSHQIPGKTRIGIPVCIIVENMSVPRDPRVWREALALTEAGYTVSVICPKEKGAESSRETRDDVEIYRHRAWQGTGSIGYILEYLWALAAEFILALRIYARTHFRILHACNPPDTIFLIARFFKLFGVRFIFDQHDPVPEFYEAKFHRKGLGYKFACLTERLTFQTADVAIATNESCRELAVRRGRMLPQDCFTVRNCPPAEVFRPRPEHSELKEGLKHLVVYVGVMGSQDGIDLLLKSIEYLVRDSGRRDTLFVLIGGGSEFADIRATSKARGLDTWVRLPGPLYGDELMAYLATADLGVSPDPLNVFNDKLTMIKILEYMACGLPVVLYDLTEGRRSAGASGLYATPNDPASFAGQIAKLLDSEELRRRMGAIGRKRIEEGMNWATEKKVLLRAYATVIPEETRPETEPKQIGPPSLSGVPVPKLSSMSKASRTAVDEQ